MRAHVGLGGNVGDREAHLAAGRHGIGALPGVRIVATSPVFETSPVGPSSDPFLNQVLEIETTLAPTALMEALLRIEQANGRERREKWGPRTLDLDLLVVMDEAGATLTLRTERLTLPHPGLTARDFVLAPLCRLAPDLIVDGKPVRAWLEELPPQARTVLRVL